MATRLERDEAFIKRFWGTFTLDAIRGVVTAARELSRRRNEVIDPDTIPMGMAAPRKFCADCKWVNKGTEEDHNHVMRDKNSHQWVCTQPDIKTKFDLVSGKKFVNYCTQVRLDDQCGPAARLWEPSEV